MSNSHEAERARAERARDNAQASLNRARRIIDTAKIARWESLKPAESN